MTEPSPNPNEGLRGTLTTPKIVLLVIAAAAPLAAVVGTVPLAFALGNGAGVPLTYALAGVVLLCFSVGYAAMSRRIVNAGGFYPYLSLGLGRPVAVGGALIAVVSYCAVAIGLVGAFGYFAALTGDSFGLHLPWQEWTAAAILLVALFGYRQIDASARILAVLMVAEIGVLTILDAGILVHRGVHALPAVALAPHAVFGAGALGVTLMFAFMSFIGFESAALYGEESANPRRSVPLATYLSVVVIAVFYALTAWLAVGGIGAGSLRQAAGAQLGDLFFGLSTQYVSTDLTRIMQVLLCTSLLAATLALHNAGNRYLFVLGRDQVLPAGLGRAHTRFHSPSRASLVQTVITVLVVGAFAIAGLAPYTTLATSMLGLGTLGIVLIQAAAAVAVVAFFRRRGDGDWWRTLLAPLLGAAGLLAAAVTMVANYPTVTGTTDRIINDMPVLLVVALLAGLVRAAVLRRRPAVYDRLARTQLRDEPEGATTTDVASTEITLGPAGSARKAA